MDFRVLASSSAGNCYLVTGGGSALLVEAGIRYPEIQRALHHMVTALAGCLISHEHQDHAKAVPDLLSAGVDVFASAGTLAALEIEGSHRAVAVPALQPFRVAPFTVLPFGAVHDAAEPLGFVIAAGDDKLLYLTDTAYCRYRFAGLTHIAIEANWSREIIRRNVDAGEIDAAHYRRVIRTHMSIERACDLLRANDLTRVREVHLLHLSNGNSDAEAFRRAAARASGKPVYVAESSGRYA